LIAPRAESKTVKDSPVVKKKRKQTDKDLPEPKKAKTSKSLQPVPTKELPKPQKKVPKVTKKLSQQSSSGFSTNVGKHSNKKQKKLTDQNRESVRGPQLTEYFKKDHPEWEYVENPVFKPRDVPRDRPTQFRHTQGLKEPFEFFEKMWDTDIWHQIWVGSVKHVAERKKPVTMGHWKRVFGMTLLRGVVGFQSIEDFWDSTFGKFSWTFDENFLPRNVYFGLTNGLKVDMKSIHESIVSLFQSVIIPGYYVCIDEIRIAARHYVCVKTKNTIYGLKKANR
jgi:hypothetical protein